MKDEQEKTGASYSSFILHPSSFLRTMPPPPPPCRDGGGALLIVLGGRLVAGGAIASDCFRSLYRRGEGRKWMRILTRSLRTPGVAGRSHPRHPHAKERPWR